MDAMCQKTAPFLEHQRNSEKTLTHLHMYNYCHRLQLRYPPFFTFTCSYTHIAMYATLITVGCICTSNSWQTSCVATSDLS